MKKDGFVALMSAIIISAILLVVIVESSIAGLNSRFSILDAESKERSEALADACVDNILLQLSIGTVSVQTVPVGSDQCKILNATSPYQVQAIYNASYTNFAIVVDPDTLMITSWTEVNYYP